MNIEWDIKLRIHENAVPGAPVGINKVKRMHSVNHKVKVTETVQKLMQESDAQIDSNPQKIEDKQYLIELDFDSQEDRMNVSRKDYVIEIDDCSFNNPTCLMA